MTATSPLARVALWGSSRSLGFRVAANPARSASQGIVRSSQVAVISRGCVV